MSSCTKFMLTIEGSFVLFISICIDFMDKYFPACDTRYVEIKEGTKEVKDWHIHLYKFYFLVEGIILSIFLFLHIQTHTLAWERWKKGKQQTRICVNTIRRGNNISRYQTARQTRTTTDALCKVIRLSKCLIIYEFIWIFELSHLIWLALVLGFVIYRFHFARGKWRWIQWAIIIITCLFKSLSHVNDMNWFKNSKRDDYGLTFLSPRFFPPSSLQTVLDLSCVLTW